jgi:hypothetical protein
MTDELEGTTGMPTRKILKQNKQKGASFENPITHQGIIVQGVTQKRELITVQSRKLEPTENKLRRSRSYSMSKELPKIKKLRSQSSLADKTDIYPKFEAAPEF